MSATPCSFCFTAFIFSSHFAAVTSISLFPPYSTFHSFHSIVWRQIWCCCSESTDLYYNRFFSFCAGLYVNRHSVLHQGRASAEDSGAQLLRVSVPDVRGVGLPAVPRALQDRDGHVPGEPLLRAHGGAQVTLLLKWHFSISHKLV